MKKKNVKRAAAAAFIGQKLKANVKDVGGLFSTGGNAAESKDKAINALQEYNRYINQDYSPQDAYLKVIGSLTQKDIRPKEIH